MSQTIAIAIITVVGIVIMACIAYFPIRIMINTTKSAERRKKKRE